MIKAAGRTRVGVPLLLLGLSGENVTRLTAGEPILIPPSQIRALGLPLMTVVVHYGRTEQAILDEFKAHNIELGVIIDERH